MKEPNFFLVGAPKCGTTALSEYLRGHPQIFFSEPKEPQYFASDFKNVGAISDLEEYLQLFSQANASHVMVGEGSTKYLHSECAIPAILAFAPAAKLIVMLRNPLDMAPALHAQVVYNGAEDIRDFESAWRMQSERREGRRVPPLCEEPKDLLYGEFCLLGEQLERLYRHARREQVMPIFFEDFAKDTRNVYEKVLDFLQVDHDGRTSFLPANANKSYRSPWLDNAMRHGTNAWLRIKERCGIEAKLGLTSRLRRVNTVNQRREPLSPRMVAELKAFFREDVHDLAKLTGRNLTHWVA